MKRVARVARCYTDQPLQPSSEVVLDKRSSHHLSTVLRAREGQAIQLFNGDGKNYSANIITTGRKTVVAISDATINDCESSLHLTLVQAIARGDKMDGIVQKATELGVSAIQPVYTKHAISKLEPAREMRKQAHWQSIAMSACEQSGRSTLPDVLPVLTLDHYLSICSHATGAEHRWVLSPTAAQAIDGVETMSHASMLIGPESGFDADELQKAETAGFKPLQLGPRVLRTETAGPAAIAVLQARFGDMN